MTDSEKNKNLVVDVLYENLIKQINEIGTITPLHLVGMGANLIGTALNIHSEKNKIDFANDIMKFLKEWVKENLNNE